MTDEETPTPPPVIVGEGRVFIVPVDDDGNPTGEPQEVGTIATGGLGFDYEVEMDDEPPRMPQGEVTLTMPPGVVTVFANDLPYGPGPETVTGSLSDTLAFSADDWAASRAMAWVWGIVCGWDDDDDPDDEGGAMADLAERWRWDDEGVARLRRLHARFLRLTALEDAGIGDPDDASPGTVTP